MSFAAGAAMAAAAGFFSVPSSGVCHSPSATAASCPPLGLLSPFLSSPTRRCFGTAGSSFRGEKDSGIVRFRKRSGFLGESFRVCSRGRRSDVEYGRGGGGARALFTGIVEEIGEVREVKELEGGGYQMTVGGGVVLEGVKLGDSIAVNGTCLTVTHFDGDSFSVGLAPETLRRTSLGEAEVGASVNLERSLQPDSRMGGHFVQGHVDGTGTISSFEPDGDSLWVKVHTTPEILKYIVPKGYIAVDGTSLTVVKVLDDESCFTFMLVAYTQQKIVIPQKKVGDKVNLEVDIVGKYVERLLQGYKLPSLT